MINGFKVITLCGSTRFKDEFLEVQKRLTLEGNIVISVGLFGHSGDEEIWNEGVKEMLDRQHLAKIDLADELFVINVGGYIGESTKGEIAYAKSKGKNVEYLEDNFEYNNNCNNSALDEPHESDRHSDENNEMAERMLKFDDWVTRVCSFLSEYGPKLGEKGTHCASFQSKPVLDKQPEVVLLGYNPNEDWDYYEEDAAPERFYEGNRSFCNPLERKKSAWKVWNRLYGSFEWANYTRPWEDGNFVFFNAVYFGSNNIEKMKKLPHAQEAIEKCLEFTGEIIQEIFRPKCIICLSVKECFDKLNLKFKFDDVEKVSTVEATNRDLLDFALRRTDGKNWKSIHNCKKTIKKASWNRIPIYGIPHTSARDFSWDDFGAIALYLKSEMLKIGI